MTARLDSLISLADVTVGARFFCKLPSFLQHPLSLEQARATLRNRLERREADFLAIARRAAYEQPGSPYRDLLKLAGCEYGDLERLVGKDGVDGALRALFRHGVYLTVDEFKGRQPVVRGSTTIAVDPDRFRNPNSRFHLAVRSSGSRGSGTSVPLDFASIRECAVDTFLCLEAQGGTGWLKAIWGVPGGTAISRFLEYSACGPPPLRWFSQVDPAAPGLHPRYRWSARAMRLAGLLAGVPLPRLQHVPLDDPLPIAHWMAEVLHSGLTPYLHTFASPAVRLCQAAFESRIELSGARFTLGGEPVTEARMAVIRRVGAHGLPRYGSADTGGSIGGGCLIPDVVDDVHLFHDIQAVIQPGSEGAASGLPATALLISSLRPTAPLILLNVSMGDQAVMTQRACGCPLEGLGWATHLHTIRSYEKLTGGGMAFLDTDVIRVLEEILPARFGGISTDYQLLEDEADDGRPRLRLFVHPAVGPLNPQAVAETFFTAISTGSGVERVMGLLWREAGLLCVERRAPLTTATGKILHLHTSRRSSERHSPGSRT